MLQSANPETRSACRALSEALMYARPVGKQHKTSRLLLIYACLMLSIQLVLHLLGFLYFTVPQMQFLKTVTLVAFWLCALFGVVTACKGPGLIKRGKGESDVGLAELFQSFAAEEICFDCGVVAMPRSLHCHIC